MCIRDRLMAALRVPLPGETWVTLARDEETRLMDLLVVEILLEDLVEFLTSMMLDVARLVKMFIAGARVGVMLAETGRVEVLESGRKLEVGRARSGLVETLEVLVMLAETSVMLDVVTSVERPMAGAILGVGVMLVEATKVGKVRMQVKLINML